jgi:hypothetical protein
LTKCVQDQVKRKEVVKTVEVSSSEVVAPDEEEG